MIYSACPRLAAAAFPGKLRQSDRLSRWFPHLPHSRQVTLAMLMESRSGYADYVSQPLARADTRSPPVPAVVTRQLVAIGTNPALFGKPWVPRARWHESACLE